jgi:hypothetical protein
MAELEPRYVATFRARTPEMIITTLLLVLGAIYVLAGAWILPHVACALDSSSDCSGAWVSGQLFIAIVGLVTALGAVVESCRRSGHPWRWFLAAVLVDTVWGFVFFGW